MNWHLAQLQTVPLAVTTALLWELQVAEHRNVPIHAHLWHASCLQTSLPWRWWSASLPHPVLAGEGCCASDTSPRGAMDDLQLLLRYKARMIFFEYDFFSTKQTSLRNTSPPFQMCCFISEVVSNSTVVFSVISKHVIRIPLRFFSDEATAADLFLCREVNTWMLEPLS